MLDQAEERRRTQQALFITFLISGVLLLILISGYHRLNGNGTPIDAIHKDEQQDKPVPISVLGGIQVERVIGIDYE